MQDALGLKKMTAFMADDDLESGTDSESNSRDKRIPKANAVDVFGVCADHEFPAGFVSGEKAFENGSAVYQSFGLLGLGIVRAFRNSGGMIVSAVQTA
jgi:hypothetical protein